MKILCIDMNIIMSPCIRLYMDRVSLYENSEVTWRTLEQNMGIGAHLSYDADILLGLAKLIGKNADAEFLETEHQDQNVELIDRLLTERENDSEIKTSENPISVTNIDFFSDMGNPGDCSNFDFGVLGEDTWLGYLAYKHPGIRTCWVKAPEADIPEMIRRSDRVEITPVSAIGDLPCDYDIIILSHSGQYVPYFYRHLGEMLGFCAHGSL